MTYLPVNSEGLVSTEELKAAIRPDTAMVSVMYVNNEIGVIQPMEEIGKICRENKVRAMSPALYLLLCLRMLQHLSLIHI